MQTTHASTPFSRADDLEAVATAARECRQRQREYFRDRTRDRLQASKRAETALDNALKVLDATGAGMRPLFPHAGISQ